MTQQKLIRTPDQTQEQERFVIALKGEGIAALVQAQVITAEQAFNLLFKNQIPDRYVCPTPTLSQQ